MLEVSISKEGLDPEWDSFLETRPDGCYQQSSLWAKLKATIGWKHLRLVARERGGIIGGAQILLRPLRAFGAVGYVSKGPVIASDGPMVQRFVLDQLDRVARKEHILFLKMQPSYGTEDVAQRLLERGALPSETVVVSQATARVDIRPEPEAILARMPSNRRGHIRRAERKGVLVREGTEADMPIFHRLIKIHSQQKGYYPYPKDYHYNLWSIFSSKGRACLLVAEHEGEVLAARMNIAFGDVTFAMFVGDSGRCRELNAQSLLTWKAMLWGKEKGCVWYDFGGVSMCAAKATRNNEPIPDTRRGRLDKFKLSFGSQLIVRPGAYDVSYVWPRRLTGRMVPAILKMRPLLSSLIGGSLWGDFE